MTKEKDDKRDCKNHECYSYGGSDHSCRLCMLWEIADLKAENEKLRELVHNCIKWR